MIEIKDPIYHKKCRIWINDVPEIQYQVTDIIEETFEANMVLNKAKIITAELLLPRNASYYALLGAKFIPDNSGEMIATVKLSDSEKNVFRNAITYDFETVFCGIPDEYGNSILKYIKDNISKLSFPSGKLCFDIGAYGIIGSSQLIFSQLTEVILKLLLLDLYESEDIKKEVLNIMDFGS